MKAAEVRYSAVRTFSIGDDLDMAGVAGVPEEMSRRKGRNGSRSRRTVRKAGRHRSGVSDLTVESQE